MKLLNEKQIFEEWAPIVEEKTQITDKSKLAWLSKYCHFHALNESSFVGGWAWPAASLQNTPGMGNVATGQVAGGAAFHSAATGSGDKFPSLLPLAIQVGARTIGFDIVPVIPMNGPSGVLTYLDYVYAGGKLPNDPSDANAENPTMIKVNIGGSYTVGTKYVATSGSNNLELIYIGKSRIDAYKIFRALKSGEKYKIGSAWQTASISTPHLLVADVFNTGSAFTIDSDGSPAATPCTATASLVKALEDHIQGYTGAGAQDGDAWTGNYANGASNPEPMRRGIGEQTYYRTMGLQTFTKFVEAETYQAAATVTTEQIQDLNRQFGIDVVGMVENSLVNEVSQSINKHILSRAFALGWTNHNTFAEVEGQNFNLQTDPSASTTYQTFNNKDGATTTMSVPVMSLFAGANPSAAFENQWTVQRRVFSRILAGGNVISQRGRRGPANFIVTNLQIATILQDSAQFTFAPMANTINQNNGSLYPVGAVAGMTVYVDPNMSWSDTRVLVGRKGADEEPGLKYMPYLMAETIQTIAEGTMTPKVAVKSRYALVEAGFHPETMYFTFFVATPAGGLV
ncbi:MAG: hypothetical protein WC979_02000 [Candidatus Pacearchaeota archaeon]